MPFEMRWDVFAWTVVALLLFAAEVLAPGAFMLWLAFAASAVLVVVWLVPGLSFLSKRCCSWCLASLRSWRIANGFAATTTW